ncbi:30S ribosomal protein S21 [Candidatus Parcubacteria bacterium]|nr:MAG: 30S ribosomal protein S21 [Candidatus Parcubacteria bacterium]
MVEVKKKKVESFESLLRRFHKKLQQSGLILQTKKIRYFERPKSKTKIKREALRRIEIKSERDYLRKIGKLKEEVIPGKRSFMK